MKFSEFVKYLEQLDKTSSRLTLIDILAELFKKSPASEIDEIIYLIQGRIAPFSQPLEIGMAEKNIAASIATAFGKDKEEVLKLYRQLGDMGLAAEQISSKSSVRQAQDNKIKSSKLSVSEVFEDLTKIAKTSGEGTVEKRQILFTNLLKQLDPTSCKYLARIPLRASRLGIGDPTVLDALALAKLGDKSKRKELEEAYNRTSDLGLIAKTLWEKGLKGVENLDLKLGSPIRSELCERLPNSKKIIEKMEEVDAQYKYDGFRVQIHKDGKNIRMFSRNLEEMTHMFPELTRAAQDQIEAESAILDSEALAYNPESEEFLPFQQTSQRRRKHGITEAAKKLPLKAFVFDILYKNGRSLLTEPLSKRMKILTETIKNDDVLIRTKNQTIKDPKELDLLLEDAISKGLEGLVVKRLESPYEAGARNFNWVKLKRHSDGELNDTVDCVILGYIYGKGKRAEFGAGALLVGVYDKKKDEFVSVSKIGTGLTDDEWREIHKRADKIKLTKKPPRVTSTIEPSVWIKPEIVIEVLADEITRSQIHTAGKSKDVPGYALRFPRLVKFRNDKRAEGATSVEELIKMFESQGKK